MSDLALHDMSIDGGVTDEEVVSALPPSKMLMPSDGVHSASDVMDLTSEGRVYGMDSLSGDGSLVRGDSDNGTYGNVGGKRYTATTIEKVRVTTLTVEDKGEQYAGPTEQALDDFEAVQKLLAATGDRPAFLPNTAVLPDQTQEHTIVTTAVIKSNENYDTAEGTLDSVPLALADTPSLTTAGPSCLPEVDEHQLSTAEPEKNTLGASSSNDDESANRTKETKLDEADINKTRFARALDGAKALKSGIYTKTSELRESAGTLTKEAVAAKMQDAKAGASQKLTRVQQATSQKMGQVKDATSQKIGEVKDATSQKLGEAKDATAQKLGEVKEVVIEKIEYVKDVVKETGEKVVVKTKAALGSTDVQAVAGEVGEASPASTCAGSE